MKYLKTIGIKSNQPVGRGFLFPYDVSFASDGKIFAINRSRVKQGWSSIHILTFDEEWLGDFGRGQLISDDDYHFELPVSIVFDSKDLLYLTDEALDEIKIFDTDAVSDSTGMDLIRHWHNNKGTGKPTIVNMSFAFFYTMDQAGTQNGDNGQCWDTFTSQMDIWTFGDPGYATAAEIEDNVDLNSFTKPAARNAAVDAKLDQMIAAGIHVSIAANNNYEVQYEYEDSAQDNYNDFMVRPGFAGDAPLYYHRGSSPRGTMKGGAEMVVGNIGVDYTNNKEPLRASSANVEAVDIFAPGSQITAGVSNVNSGFYADTAHPDDGSWKIGNSSGTSFACPQVVGVGALYLQNEPNLTPDELKAKMLHDAKTGVLYDDLNWDQKDLGKYADHVTTNKGLMGGPNKVLHNRLTGDVFVRYVTEAP